jgi:hypothetical protein
MRKLLSIISIFFCAMLPTIVFAINIYDNPTVDAKVIAIANKQLMPIIFTQKRDWVKVANPLNGDVGWAKVDELKGPIVTVKTNGSTTHQQIIVEQEDKGDHPEVYSIIQYSGSHKMKPEEAQKMVKDMEERSKAMGKSMRKMREQMQKNMMKLFKEFDEDFYTFPVIQPIIVVPDNHIEDKIKNNLI